MADNILDVPSGRGAVVVCSDANWAWQSSFLLMRALALDPGTALDHHLYLTGPVDPRILALLPPEIAVHRVDSLPDSFAGAATGHIPAATMLRMIALEELAPRYARVIYLDGDVFQAHGALADLMQVDMGGKALAAVRDRAQWAAHERRWLRRYFDGLAQEAGIARLDYFNAGVLMVDGPQFSARGLARVAVDFHRQRPELCKFGDQSALNFALAGNWCELSPAWNWQVSQQILVLAAGQDPRLIHFTGPIKPWNDAYRIFPPEAFGAMLAFLERHDLVDLLTPEAPIHFDPGRMERVRMRKLQRWEGDEAGKRELVESYLARRDFADLLLQPAVPQQ